MSKSLRGISLLLLIAAWPLGAFAQPEEGEQADQAPAAEASADEAATPSEPAEEWQAPEGTEEAEVPPPPAQSAPAHETVCNDHQDDDNDGMPDCADADCYDNEYCQAGGADERSNDACSDWIDNDGDGAVDCTDTDCTDTPGVTVCNGSWQGNSGGAGSGGATDAHADELPELSGDMSVEDLIGRGDDIDGERNDYLCSDGVDNDQDGRTDCQDFGCRFDPSVTVCSGSPGVRFSVVVGVAGSLRLDETPDIDGDGLTEYSDPVGDVRFTRLQLRALGPIPFIENSFFLINMRAERSLRVTFATFNIPLNNEGHYISVNSGSGGLSPGLIVSASKQPLLDPAFYLFNAFEQRNGAALEIGGPITSDNVLRFRAFAAGGSGESNGNIGGRFFRSDERNFSYSAGAQLHWNIIGQYDRFDTPFLYTPVPTTLAILAGARFDQRPVERYAAWNVFGIFRTGPISIRAESYSRYVFDFEGLQTAWNVQAVGLLIPRTLMVAADVGGYFVPLGYNPAVLDEIGGFSSTFRQPVEQFQVRGALHWYYFRNIGILSLMYSMNMECQHVFGDVCQPGDADPEAPITKHEVRLEAQFRF